MNKKGNKLLKYFQFCDGTDTQGWYVIWYDILIQVMNNPYLHLADDFASHGDGLVDFARTATGGGLV